MPQIVEPTLAYAQQQDREDELQSFRSRFYFPQRPTNPGAESSHSADPTAPIASDAPATNTPHSADPLIYFCGNSLGLQPREAEEAIRQELADWRELAIDGYWKARKPWMTYPQAMSGPLSRLAGCQEEEVTVMNALTVNLHLLLLTFYRPGLQIGRASCRERV